MTKTNAPRVLDIWREALATRCENALILAPVTCQDARELLAYVKALEAENARLQASIDLLNTEVENETNREPLWLTDEYTERFGE